MIYLNKYDFFFSSDSSDSDEFFWNDHEPSLPFESLDPLILSQNTDDHSSLNSTKSSVITVPLEKSGWLQKQADSLLKTWQWRYFTLSSHKLQYFHKKNDEVPAGIINFSQVEAKIHLTPSKKPLKLKISIKGLNYSMQLRSESTKEIQEWGQVIQNSIEQCEGKIKELPLRSLGEKFWKYERISEYYFQTNACTGDILLFRSKDVSSKIQRSLTGSKFDHIALILCYASGKIVLLESTQSMGVSLTDWEEFLMNKWQDLYEGIVYRSLVFDRNDANLLSLNDFVNKVKGKSYGLSPKKFLLKGSYRAPGDEKDFFCSELVASAYKSLGIINEKIPSNNFLPGSFEDDKTLGLIDAKLGPAMIINF